MFYREISDSYSMVFIGLELEINENTSVFWLIHFVLFTTYKDFAKRRE